MRCFIKRFWGALILLLATGSMAHGEEDAIPRDPFWPVGYEKPKPPSPDEKIAQGVLAPRPDQVWPELPVQGTSRSVDGRYFALVKNMGVVTAGEDISLEKDGLWYHWRIADIGPHGIRAQKLGVSEDRNRIPQPTTPAGNGQSLKEQ